MGRFDTIKTTIDANIKENGSQEITGQKMNSILTEMVNATDAELTELESKLGGTITNRINAPRYHSSSNDRIYAKIKAGTKFYMLAQEVTASIISYIETYIQYTDGTTKQVRCNKNTLSAIVAEKDVESVGIYFESSPQGLVDFSITGGFLPSVEDFMAEAKPEIGDLKNAIFVTGDYQYYPSLAKATIYNGNFNRDTTFLTDETYYPVLGGSSLKLFHAEDISIRVTEYDADKQYIKQTGYSQYNTLVTNAATSYVRISANYTNRGVANIAFADYQSGDFGLMLPNTKLNEVRLLDHYLNKDYFVNGSKYTYDVNHSCRIIPVNEGDVITALANNVVNTRIAFLYSWDESTITQNSAIDGIGNQNIAVGEWGYFIVPQGCHYIALNTLYSNKKSIPIYLSINGITYVDSTNTNIGISTIITDIAKRIDASIVNAPAIVVRNIEKDAAVYGTGKVANTGEIKPLSFLHISDIHTNSANFKCFENACEFLQHYSNIAFGIVTGDLVMRDFSDSMQWYNSAIQKTTKPILNVIGNHDAGQHSESLGLAAVGTDVQIYEKYIAPYKDSWGIVQPSNAESGKCYYYKDFSDEKIRLIVLNEFETDYEILSDKPNELKFSREWRSMRQEQVDWLIDSLYNTPSDYGVIVAYHQPDSMSEEDNPFVSDRLSGNSWVANIYSTTRDWLPRIFHAYKNKQVLNFTFAQTGGVYKDINVVADFTQVQSEFICILNGHTHDDYIGHNKDYNDLTMLVVGSDNLGYTGKYCARHKGYPSEDLFNVVNIDRNRKTISVIRIGADASVTGQVRKQILIKY